MAGSPGSGGPFCVGGVAPATSALGGFAPASFPTFAALTVQPACVLTTSEGRREKHSHAPRSVVIIPPGWVMSCLNMSSRVANVKGAKL